MRNAIYEYLEPDIKSKKELWESAIFVFDTNVLLNLYRYSTNTREELIEAISSFQDRIWMPYHIATEFMKNRYKIIFDTVKSFELLEEEANNFVKTCMESIRLKEDNPEILELKSYLNNWLEKHSANNLLVKKPSEDEILNKVLELYEGQVGEALSEEKKEEIYKEGEKRYQTQVPPGYKDEGKSENSYGDLILWKEILKYSKENHKNIIFITQDRKEDWWNKCCGKTIGPRIELRKEFIIKTEQKFNMYTMDSFIEIYSENKDGKLDQRVINEVNTIGNTNIWILNDIYKYKINKGKKYTYNLLKKLGKEQLFNAHKDIEICQNKMNNKMNTIIAIENKYVEKEMPPHVKEQFENTKKNMHKLEIELFDLKDLYSNLLESI